MGIIGKDVLTAVRFLRQGDAVGLPTETVYGLAANALQPESVTHIFEIKERPLFDPLIVHIGQLSDLEKYASHVPEKARILAQRFWPGPLTLVLPKNSVIPFQVTSGLESVAIRMPDHAMALDVLQHLDFPLAAPSANPFGYVSPTSAQHVFNQLGDKIPYILDGGPCRVGLESTIISFTEDIPRILRLGVITREMVESCIGAVLLQVHGGSNPAAPGMLDQHYSPITPLHWLNRDAVPEDSETGFLCWTEKLEGIPDARQWILSREGNFVEASANLYAYLRELDEGKFSMVYVEEVPEEGIGMAINDRLRRAVK